MTQPTNSDALEPADLLLIGLPFMNDAWAKYPNDREHMKQAFKASEGYKQALTALTEREERIKREAKVEELKPLLDAFIEVGGFSNFVRQLNSRISELTKNTNPKEGK